MFSCFNIVALLMLWRCPPRKHQFTETGERNLLVVTEGLQIFSWIILFLIISLILSFLFSLSFKIVIYMVSNLRVCWFLYNYLLFFLLSIHVFNKKNKETLGTNQPSLSRLKSLNLPSTNTFFFFHFICDIVCFGTQFKL